MPTFRAICYGRHRAITQLGLGFERGDDRHREPQMAYLIMFLFVAYIAPLFFFGEIEPYARSLPVEQKKPAKDSQKDLVSA